MTHGQLNPNAQNRQQWFFGLPLCLIGLFLIIEWNNRRQDNTLSARVPWSLQRTVQIVVLLIILFYGKFGETEFIYFQF
ncbi:MAG: hypothetical protein K8H89_14390 [Flavobacteriales bacterium]|nr:hypothetical protein [Flavobacteriales bacterium]